jgi:hypothetical protein
MIFMNEPSKKWTVYIITHKHIFPWLYTKDKDFNRSNYRFVNTSSHQLKITNSLFYQVMDLAREPGFIPLGDHYAESEAIYNIYKNPKFYSRLDYIGFLHYDFEFISDDGSCNITEQINGYLQDKTKAHIAFITNNTTAIYHLRMLADVNQPNTLCGTGYNCYDYILNDYNNYFHTNYTLDDMFRQQSINMCSSFLIDIQTFLKMMGLIADVIESGKLDFFDTRHQFRIQSHLLERYYSVFLLFEYAQSLNLMLPHLGQLKFIH